MANLAIGLSQASLPKLGIDPSKAEGLRSWFTSGSYRIDGNHDGKKLTLADIKLNDVASYLSFDYERFALSSLESFKISLMEFNGHGYPGWSIIKLYYSAFFAAHAAMRLCGTSIVKLDKEHVDFLQSISDVYVSRGGQIKSGMYQVRFVQSGVAGLTAIIERQPDGLGAHEGFWRAFDTFLNTTATELVKRGVSDAGDFVAGVNELQPMLRPNGGRKSAWISAMRNEVNYQHLHGSWQPNKLDRNTSNRLAAVGTAASSTIRLDFKLDKDASEAFVAVSHFLASLNVELGNVVAANSTAARAFGQSWRRLI